MRLESRPPARQESEASPPQSTAIIKISFEVRAVVVPTAVEAAAFERPHPFAAIERRCIVIITEAK